jgi:hypothetical protein
LEETNFPTTFNFEPKGAARDCSWSRLTFPSPIDYPKPDPTGSNTPPAIMYTYCAQPWIKEKLQLKTSTEMMLHAMQWVREREGH